MYTHHIHSQFIVVSFGFFNTMKIKKNKQTNKTDVICMCVRVCDIKKTKDIKEKTKPNKQDNHRRSIN
jgi:hypothetical protein